MVSTVEIWCIGHNRREPTSEQSGCQTGEVLICGCPTGFLCQSQLGIDPDQTCWLLWQKRGSAAADVEGGHPLAVSGSQGKPMWCVPAVGNHRNSIDFEEVAKLFDVTTDIAELATWQARRVAESWPVRH